MIKSIIANGLSGHGASTVMSEVDCSQFSSCSSCIAQQVCGFCGNVNKCVSGGWFGALDKSSCGLNDYYFHQCHMSTLPLGILSIALVSIIVIILIIGLSILCCCFCCKCCQRENIEDEDEDRPLLGSKYLRRSSTYYQWNRQPIVVNKINHTENTKSTSSIPVDQVGDAEPPYSSSTTANSWENRRTALLKKYAREPTLPNE
ncbi:hypothetical protein BD408DRAFT_413682 [Parasitella parasitica]|nr:hypothetical protein BD408DRAFT_413682 [Parasitella parasitica]